MGSLLGGCGAERTIHRLRAANFQQERTEGVTTSVQARALYLQVSPGGGLTAESIDAANRMLTSQGPIRRQVLTIVALSPAGEKLAPRLAKTLTDAGANPPRRGAYEVEAGAGSAPAEDLTRQQQGWDIELISEAVVVNAPDCTVAQPDLWTVSPYYAIGTLGCANEANIAMMASDPRDLIRPRALAPTEGKIATSAVERYFNDETKELIDIDFGEN
ncbi:CpaD family pilus assembly lipoprotein [Pseudodesulfovibrio alkaliphilus]|nr:CpaD family pilus assembly lipoprotein [Pseudodesulfovibrio alkaliphilus]